jgi:type IV pilus assembly protein PilX
MVMHAPRTTQRGAALVVGLLLLSILTLLAIAGMNTASTELVMAGNEQFRETAFQSAEIGVERELVTLDANAPFSAPVTRSAAVKLGEIETTVTYRGFGDAPAFGKKYIAYHYQIESTGSAARNATATHEQGAYYVNQLNPAEVSPLSLENYELAPGVTATPLPAGPPGPAP